MPFMVPLVLQDLARHAPLDPPVTAEVLAFVSPAQWVEGDTNHIE